MSKQLPNTREEAFAYQFEDDVKILHSMSVLSKEGFKKHLAVLQAHIDAYNNLDLQKSCEEAERKQGCPKMAYNGWVYEKVCLDELSNYHNC